MLVDRGLLSCVGSRRHYQYFLSAARKQVARAYDRKTKICRTCQQPRPTSYFPTVKTPWRCIVCCRHKRNEYNAQRLVAHSCKSCKKNFLARQGTKYCSLNCRSHGHRAYPIRQWRPNLNVPDRIAAFVAAHPGSLLQEIVGGSRVRKSTCKFEVNQMFHRQELRREGTPGRYNSVGYRYWIKYPRECAHNLPQK